jgi:hypothetical protein
MLIWRQIVPKIQHTSKKDEYVEYMVKHNVIYTVYLNRAVIMPSYMIRLLHRAIFRLVPRDIELLKYKIKPTLLTSRLKIFKTTINLR